MLKSRYEETYQIEEIILYLECESSIAENNSVVEFYKKTIVSLLPEICNSIEELDYEAMYNILEQIMHKRPSRMHKMAHYELEKIFSYLEEASIIDM